MRIVSYIVILILIVLGLSFAILNAESVTLNYYLGSGRISLSLLLVFTLALGIIIGMLACFKPWFSLQRRNRALQSKLRNIEKEVVASQGMMSKDNH